jgi:4-hydroxy-3-polyprenylbenzoate decarboxylase
LLFENNGTNFPVLINALGSEKRMKIALGVHNFDDIGNEMESLFKNVSSPKNKLSDKLRMLPELASLSSYMPKRITGKGICQEVIHKDPDLGMLPVLKTWGRDGGPLLLCLK